MENELDDPSTITFERRGAGISIERTLAVWGEVEFQKDPGHVPMHAWYNCEGYYDEDDAHYGGKRQRRGSPTVDQQAIRVTRAPGA